MRILQINASYKPAFIYGGPTMSVAKLSEQLVIAGCDVSVFTTTANGAGELPVAANTELKVDGVKVTYFKRLTKDHSHFAPALLVKLWRDVKGFDIIHIHAWWNLVSVLSCYIGLLRGVSVVVSPRGTLSSYSFDNNHVFAKRLMHQLFGKRLLNKTIIHVTSPREAARIKGHIQPKNIIDIPNFINLPDYHSREISQPRKGLKLLFLSRIEAKKGLDILLNSLATVTVPYHLTIAGTGDPAYINSLKLVAQKNNISTCISWVGFQYDNKFQLMQEHDLLVLPSHDENFGNVVIESLSVGTSVLISDNVGLAAYVEKNNLGWICANNAFAVSKSINQISSLSDRLSEIRLRAPGMVRNDFSEQILTQKYLAMYNQSAGN